MEVKLTKSSLITNPSQVSNHKEVTMLNKIFLDPLQFNALDVKGGDMLLVTFQIEEQLLLFVMDIRLNMQIREKK